MVNTLSTDTTPSSDNALEFCLRLARAYAVLTRRLDNTLSSVHGLSFSDFMIMYHLHRAEGARLRRIDLAERVGLTASGVTRSLLPLEKIGIVSRQADPRDARVGYAILTTTGQELFVNALKSAGTVCRDVTESVSEDQIASLLPVLGRLSGMNPSKS